jgi:hypothetical protein
MKPLVFEQLALQFGLDKFSNLQTLGEGHIHETYLVKNNKTVVLQKVNTGVFPNQKSLMNNFKCTQNHLADKQKQKHYPYEVLSLLPTINGQLFWEDESLGVWRAFEFVPETISLQTVATPEQAFQVAQAFGAFNKALLDSDLSQFDEVITDFHNVHVRFEQLQEAIGQASDERLVAAVEALRLVEEYHAVVIAFDVLVARGLPMRVTHNDTKINNVLLNQGDGLARCVIDLDTVMPGYLMYDFGDMVRTVASPEPEDSMKYDRVQARPEILAALVAGYMDSLGDAITPIEVESLVLGAKLLPYMIGLRFLADYLRGDTYFKTAYPEHNLVRALNQFTLLTSLDAQETQLHDMLKQCLPQ